MKKKHERFFLSNFALVLNLDSAVWESLQQVRPPRPAHEETHGDDIVNKQQTDHTIPYHDIVNKQQTDHTMPGNIIVIL